MRTLRPLPLVPELCPDRCGFLLLLLTLLCQLLLLLLELLLLLCSSFRCHLRGCVQLRSVLLKFTQLLPM